MQMRKNKKKTQYKHSNEPMNIELHGHCSNGGLLNKRKVTNKMYEKRTQTYVVITTKVLINNTMGRGSNIGCIV